MARKSNTTVNPKFVPASTIRNHLSAKDIESHSERYFKGIPEGKMYSPRILNQITRAQLGAELTAAKKAGLDVPDNASVCVTLPVPFRDDAIRQAVTGVPAMRDIVNDGPDSYIESQAKLEEYYAKTLGFTDVQLYNPGAIKEDLAFVPEGTQIFGKTLTSNISALHAVADGDIVLLNQNSPHIVQAIFATEANKGKDYIIDLLPPYKGTAPAYFGFEDQELIDTDFEVTTRNGPMHFLWSKGRITEAARKMGLSAYPQRDFYDMSTNAHFLGMRDVRERKLLGVSLDVTSIPNEYVPPTSLNYAGIHDIIAGQNPNNDLVTVLSGADVGSGQTAWDRYKKLDTLMNQVANLMRLAKVDANTAICDMNAFAIFRDGMMQRSIAITPAPVGAFGVSSIQLNLAGLPPLTLIAHPYLPRASGMSAVYLLNTTYLTQRVGWRDEVTIMPPYPNTAYQFAMSSCETFVDKTDVSNDMSATLQGAVVGITHNYPSYGGV